MRRKLFSLYRTCYLNGITECVLRNSCRREGRCSRLARRSLRVRNAKQRLRNLSKAVGCKISKPSKASLIIVYIPILYMPYIPLFVYIPILYIDRETWKARARSPEPRVPVDISISCIRAERVGPLTPDTRQVKAKPYTLNFLSLARSLARPLACDHQLTATLKSCTTLTTSANLRCAYAQYSQSAWHQKRAVAAYMKPEIGQGEKKFRQSR